MGWTHGRPWEQWENDLVLSGAPTSEIARITGRKKTNIMSQRTRLRRTQIIKQRSKTCGFQSVERHHPGPAQWSLDRGAPCAMCQFHNDKFIRSCSGKGTMFRDECRYCDARFAYADAPANSGMPQRPGYFETIADHYQTTEID